ncbi:unnamed protein product [Brachionus calyciflorus]|uniref:Uncharacterized protein n=1 Tax=Brachionus calyciflorus TaxID=104777 RepID=A0A814JKP3_9BILA|nr:unnamed protein product [Brachionus calyciflorus]
MIKFYSNIELWILAGHSRAVSSLKIIEKNVLTSGSYDASIIIWDLENYAQLKTLKDSTFILDLKLIHDYLASVLSDGTIKFWDTDTGSCLEKIEKKTTILCNSQSCIWIEVKEIQDLICGFSDGTFKIFQNISKFYVE